MSNYNIFKSLISVNNNIDNIGIAQNLKLLILYPLLRSRDGKLEGSTSVKKMQQIGMTEKGPPAEQAHANGGKICYEP